MALNHEGFSHENSYHGLIYETKFFFHTWGDNTAQACTSNLFSYDYNVYLLIAAQITVHDS